MKSSRKEQKTLDMICIREQMYVRNNSTRSDFADKSIKMIDNIMFKFNCVNRDIIFKPDNMKWQ